MQCISVLGAQLADTVLATYLFNFYLQSAYYMADTILSALQVLTYFFLITL